MVYKPSARKNQLMFSPSIMAFQRRSKYLAHNNEFKTGKCLKICSALYKTTSVIRFSI
jgi:hypothetical protein